MLSFLLAACFCNIHREKCGVNIDGHYWDFTALSKGLGLMSIPEGNEVYYFRLCDVIQRSDLPSYATFENDMSVLMCRERECDPAVSLHSFDWKLLVPDNPGAGVIYHADGEPFQTNNVWTTFDIDVNLDCDPTSTSEDPPYTVTITNRSNEISMRMHIKTYHACPKTTPAPTPTPEWIPDCDYKFKFYSIVSMGVFIDFHAMNGGPGGIRNDMQAGPLQRTLFFQPCERMECPWGYTCDTDGYSSVWLCDPVDKDCESYGVIESPGNLNASFYWNKVDFDSAITTLTYRNDQTKRTTTLNVSCNPFYEMDHFEFRPLFNLVGGDLTLTALAADACPTFSPTPIPAPEGMCVFRALNDILNLSTYDAPDSTGWTKTVTINGDPDNVATLYVQPCDGMACPTDHDCEGDDHATVWLCINKDCKAYGLLANNMSARVSQDPVGISVNYKGDRKRQANIIYTYDKEATATSPVLPSDVTLQNTLVLNLVVGTNHFKNAASGGLSGGAIFLIVFFVGIFVYILATVLINYALKREWGFPHKDFWLEVAVCIKWGAVFAFTCGKVNLGASTEVKYDAI